MSRVCHTVAFLLSACGALPAMTAPHADVKHVMVYDEPGRFAAWPANGGLWSWDGGKELVVTFEVGCFRDRPDHQDGHAKDERSNEDYLARSLDGGRTWTFKKYAQFDGGDERPRLGQSMRFYAEGFAFKSQNDRFYYSENRGHKWSGPFLLQVDGVEGDMAARTSYLVTGPDRGLFFLAVEPDGAQELAFTAETRDGGLHFSHRGWMTAEDPPANERWVMPSVVQLDDGHLVAAIRRKDVRRLSNWIDLYESHDAGQSWEFVSKVADTAIDGESFNGNPPSMIQLQDGRLLVVYGVRAPPFRIAVRISDDEGKTWSEELTLRGGARNWDLGYPQTVQREDGMVVTIYYFATPENRDQFIAATIWDPDEFFPVARQALAP